MYIGIKKRLGVRIETISLHFTQWSAYFYAVQISKKYSTHAKPNEKSRFSHFCVILFEASTEFFCEFGGKRQNGSFKFGGKRQKWHFKFGGKRHFGVKTFGGQCKKPYFCIKINDYGEGYNSIQKKDV